MSITKNNVVKKITQDAHISNEDGFVLLEFLLLFLKTKTRTRSVKFSGFGTFSFKKTPKRVGRNPITKDSYIIPELNKLSFKPSNKLKEKIN